jgi:CRP/FNR family cyclic AMP-dependent transcriptional regulator
VAVVLDIRAGLAASGQVAIEALHVPELDAGCWHETSELREDLIDQLFNSTEKRLARTLLLLARYGAQGHPQEVFPKISREMLAEMIGRTRCQVNFSMNKFRKPGFIQYNGEIHINNSLLSVVLHE